MNIEKFEKDMAVFSFRQHQDVLTYLSHLEASGWTIEDAREWVEGEKKRLANQSNGTAFQAFPCPLCGKPMGLLPVNVGPGTAVRGGWRSVYLCQNQECMHTIYNKESVEEIQKKGGK